MWKDNCFVNSLCGWNAELLNLKIGNTTKMCITIRSYTCLLCTFNCPIKSLNSSGDSSINDFWLVSLLKSLILRCKRGNVLPTNHASDAVMQVVRWSSNRVGLQYCAEGWLFNYFVSVSNANSNFGPNLCTFIFCVFVLNGTRQFLVCADCNSLRENTRIVKRKSDCIRKKI